MVATLAAFRLIPELRPGVLGVFCWYIGMGLIPWISWAMLGLALIWSILSRPFWNRWRVAGFLGLIAVGCSEPLFGTYPSSHDRRPSRVAFRLPLDGPITVAWGGPTKEANYHVVAPDQRWAFDLLVTRKGTTHEGAGSQLSDCYCYGLPILAPAAGEVVKVFDGDPDMPIGQLGGGTSASGNHVVLKAAPGEYLWICHMQPRSMRVKVGEHIVEGQVVGKVGNSGNTSEPHLHVHLQDGSDEDLAEGIPMEFHHYTVQGQFVDHGIPTGGILGDRFVGQVVENAPVGSNSEKTAKLEPSSNP
jgi:murein DD-endopeptidase MepM/ murein hydrolase activator NlpD